MTLQSLGGNLILPSLPTSVSGPPNYGNILADAVNEKAAFLIQAPATGSITHIEFRTGTVTTGTTVDVRLETVDATTGDPTGTLWGTNTNGSQVIANADDNTWFATALTASASVTKGDLLAVVIAAPAAGSFSYNIATFADDNQLFPYGAIFTTSWLTISTESGVGALRYSGDVYYPIMGLFPYSAINTHTYNNGSIPDVHALRFQIPYKARATGFWLWADFDGDCVVKLYNSDGVSVMTSLTLDKDFESDTTAGLVLLQFTGTATLEPNTNYYLGVEPSSATSLSIYSYNVSSSGLMSAADFGSNWVYATAKDPTGTGSWTVTTTRRPFMGIVLDQIDYNASSGGASAYTYVC